MKRLRLLLLCLSFLVLAFLTNAQAKSLRLTTQGLQDKIKGGWAGQTIGVTFGGPYEFQFNGTFISDYQPLAWYDGYLKKTMLDNPGLYDDLYMDLTFVDVFEKYGMDASVDSFAQAFARAAYPLWHANQAARYNILQGIKAPASGFWKNNPHADCIDYQIEADFAGLMSPGMPNTASAISDKIGHIMNYGDGWYGGVFVGAMYTQAFVSSDIRFIIREALKTIPEESSFHQCISDVIRWHKKYPGDWKQTWFEVQRKWAEDRGCPDGVFAPFNIDARVNAAYIVIGLLYGNGDFTRTLDITTRCGQDADCNPSSAGGILGTLLGYEAIPAYWKQGLAEAETIPFKYTNMSLTDVYAISYKHAVQQIKNNGGIVEDTVIRLPLQKPVSVRLEKSFENCYPTEKIHLRLEGKNDQLSFSFTGSGFVIKGESGEWNNRSADVIQAELTIDDGKPQSISLPMNFLTRRHEVYWNYDLPEGHHKVYLHFYGNGGGLVRNLQALIYSKQPVAGKHQ